MTNPQAALEELEQIHFKEKKVLSCLKRCRKKLSFKSSIDLWNLASLAKWLYIYGYDDHALHVCHIIDDVEFTGDFQIWTPVEDLLLLETRLYRERKNKKQAKKLAARILTPMAPHLEAFHRRLSFDWLNDESIARCLKNHDLRAANEWRFSDLGSLFFIRELGEGQLDIHGQRVDSAQAEERIIAYKRILQQVK